MNMRCKTVTIETKDGLAVINESDFDKSKHKLYKKPVEKADKKEGKAK